MRAERQGRGVPRPLLGIAILIAYLVPALVEFWHILPHPATYQPEFGAGDVAKYDWFVAWVPYALGHGINPFVTHVVNVPFGVNLMNDTSVLGLGLLFSPVTVLFGPFATVNLLLILAFPLSAGAGYLLARRYVDWRPAAFAAGLLYGYSPYMVGQGYSHLNLSFVPLPPLILLTLDELFVRQRHRPWIPGVALGVLVCLQFMISTEITATTALFAAIALVVVAAVNRHQVRQRLRHAAIGIAVGAVLAAVVLAVPVYETILGPNHIRGVIAGFRIYDSALLGPLMPTSLLEFGTHHMKAIGDRIGGNDSENGSYLGVPLVALVVIAPFLIRRRTARVAAALAVVAFILTLGVRLNIGLARFATTTRDVVLPGAVLSKVPLFNDSFPVRYSLYVVLFVAVVLAVVLESLHTGRWTQRDDEPVGGGRRPAQALVLPAVVAVVVLLPLVPRWPGPVEGRVANPPYFTTKAVDALHPGEVTLVYPVPVNTNSSAMDWQAAAGLRFSMPGGYFVVPAASGSQFFTPTLTEENLAALANGQVLGRTPQLRARITGELRSWHVQAVLVQPVGADPVGFFTWLVGRPPDARTGGMIEWYQTAWAASK